MFSASKDFTFIALSLLVSLRLSVDEFGVPDHKEDIKQPLDGGVCVPPEIFFAGGLSPAVVGF